MKEIEELDQKYLVLKWDDINNLTFELQQMVNKVSITIRQNRLNVGKKTNDYVVLNLDDEFSMPYLNARIQYIITKRMYDVFYEKKQNLPLKIKDIAIILINSILKVKESKC